MDKVLRVLLKIEKVPDISQRQLAKTTGYSLGSVNGILQKLIDDGEILSKPLTPNHYVYELTEKGRQHKARLLYDFAVDSYNIIAGIRRRAKAEIEKAIKEGVSTFYLYGQEDALYRLVKMSMIEYKRKANIHYDFIQDLEDVNGDKPYRIFVWNKETLELGDGVINILLA